MDEAPVARNDLSRRYARMATDAMTDMTAEVHENSVQRIFPMLGETGTTAEIIALLKERGASA